MGLSLRLCAVLLLVSSPLLGGCQPHARADAAERTLRRANVEGSVAEVSEAVRAAFDGLSFDDISSRVTGLDGYVRGTVASGNIIEVRVRRVTDDTSYVSTNFDHPIDEEYVLSRVRHHLHTRR